MRTPISIMIGLATVLLTGCVGWTGTSALKSTDNAIFAGYVETSSAAFLGPMPAMALPHVYTIDDCFRGTGTVKDVPGLIVGTHPLDVVCKQYRDVDLRDYPASTADCFAKGAEEVSVTNFSNFQHPWLTPNPSAECVKLIADIQAVRKDR